MSSQARKRTQLILAGIVLYAASVLFPNILAAQELYAPKVDPPKNIENRDMWVGMIEKWNIPGKNEVKVPAYPGAVIVAFKEAGKMSANGVDYQTLPVIILATGDTPAKVLAFYQEKLQDWRYKNQFGMADIFWKGKDDFNSLDITAAATQPNVTIMEPLSAQTDFMPDAKATISIVYNTSR